MKVLFFLHRIGPYHHARFQAVASLLDLTVVETRPASQEYAWEFNTQGKYQIAKFPVTENKEIGLRGRQLHKHVEDMLETHQPTVVVTTGWADAEYHAAVLASHLRKIPLVVISDSRYEDEPRFFLKEFVKRLVVRSYSAALVAGTSSRDYLKRLGFKDPAIFQPWDVVDNVYFNSITQNYAYNEREFLCISRFVSKKNLFTLLRSYALYIKAGGNRHLRLLGSGELEDKIKLKIKELGIGQTVQLEGFVQYEQLPFYLAKAQCLILPSSTDQWGLVVNEAMAAGLPVIVSDNCGCAIDLVKQGENGFTFDPLKEDELLKWLMAMNGTTEFDWNRMSRTSRNVISKWNVEHFAGALQNACKYAMENSVTFAFKPLHKYLSR